MLPPLDPFPKNDKGALTNPAFIQQEGQRIRDSLAAGTYGNQPIQAAVASAGVPAVTVAPASSVADFASPSDPFFNQPSIWEQNQNPAQLRQGLQLDLLRNTAAQRRFDLERSQTEAPLRDRLIEAQTNAAGAHDRFLREQDAATLGHTAGFFNTMTAPGAPGPHEVGYHDYVMKALAKNPRFAETPGGKDVLSKLANVHDTHVSMGDLQKQYGDTLSSVTIGKNGEPSVTLKPPVPDAELHKAAKGYGLTLDQIRNPVGAEVGRRGKDGAFVGDEAGDIVRVADKEGKKVQMSVKEYQRLGGTFSPEGSAKQGAAPAIDLTALARKALNDPNAPEDVRAAARKRLSGQ